MTADETMTLNETTGFDRSSKGYSRKGAGALIAWVWQLTPGVFKWEIGDRCGCPPGPFDCGHRTRRSGSVDGTRDAAEVVAGAELADFKK